MTDPVSSYDIEDMTICVYATNFYHFADILSS